MKSFSEGAGRQACHIQQPHKAFSEPMSECLAFVVIQLSDYNSTDEQSSAGTI